jgi:hypothetical protein
MPSGRIDRGRALRRAQRSFLELLNGTYYHRATEKIKLARYGFGRAFVTLGGLEAQGILQTRVSCTSVQVLAFTLTCTQYFARLIEH